MSQLIEDYSFEEFKRETPLVSSASLLEDGSYVKCNARVPNPNGGVRKTCDCGRMGILRWKLKPGCCVIEHANGEQHTIGYDDVVNLKPAPIDQANHNRILELDRMGRGD